MEATFTVSLLYFLLFVLTLGISSVFSMAGLGSASTLIPIYNSLGIIFSVAASAGLLLNVVALTSGTINNGRNHYVNWKTGIMLMIPAVVAAPFGAIVGIGTSKKILLSIFVVFLAFTLFNLIRSRKGTKKGTRKIITTGIRGIAMGLAVGAVVGFMGGLLGIGGGMIVLPVLTFIESDYKKIPGTTGFVVLFISISGFLSYLAILRGVDYTLWIIVIIGGILGGLIGSHFTHRFRPQTIRYFIILIIGVVMIKLIYTVLI